MPLFNPGDPVKLASATLNDLSQKSNHHLFTRCLKEDMLGVVRERDLEKSTPECFYYWVKFHFFAILLPEHHLLKS